MNLSKKENFKLYLRANDNMKNIQKQYKKLPNATKLYICTYVLKNLLK